MYSNKLINYASDHTSVLTSVLVVKWIKTSSKSVTSLKISIATFSSQDSCSPILRCSKLPPGEKSQSTKRMASGIPGHLLVFRVLLFVCVGCAPRVILVPPPGTEPMTLALEAWRLNHGTSREVLVYSFYFSNMSSVPLQERSL